MRIFRIEADVSECQSIVFDIDDYLDVLDPSIGEKQAMFLPMVNLSVAEVWSSIELAYFQNEGTVDLADVSLWKAGLLLMNQKGYDALHDVLAGSGEFLPCELHGKAAYIFNCLELKPENGAKVSYKEKNGWKQSVEAIEFPDGWNEPLFKFKNELTFNLYGSEAFRVAYDSNGLKGLSFSLGS
ncbi:MAG: hypothetical protein VX474_06940 [Pseudomonadota bacterium]|nr:hypothetical protein [Pseudomonadota bacterium]MEE2749696.1 hypothetical protein [Pseudomonadota bacterium]